MARFFSSPVAAADSGEKRKGYSAAPGSVSLRPLARAILGAGPCGRTEVRPILLPAKLSCREQDKFDGIEFGQTQSARRARTRDGPSHNALLTQFARDVFTIVPVSLVFFVPFLLETKTRFGFIANMLIGLALLAVSVWLLRRFVP